MLTETTYQAEGCCIVDDFLPEPVANELYECYATARFEDIDQVRDHYKHVFSTSHPYLPGPDELYMAKFGRSQALETLERVAAIFDQYFKPALRKVSGVDLTHHDLRCYRLKSGDFYRAHFDDYAGAIGGNYYLSREWKWDWGGIFHIASDSDPEHIEAIFPKFNRMVFLDHQVFRFPHFVSAVSSFAKTPRYALISFSR